MYSVGLGQSVRNGSSLTVILTSGQTATVTWRSALRKLKGGVTVVNSSRKHLAETGMSYWVHFGHVLFMMGCMFLSLIFAPLHALVPGWFPGWSRKWMFDIPLKHQLKTRPTILMDIQKEYEDELNNN